MLALVSTTKFEKDLKRAKKRGLDLSKLASVLDALCAEEPLPLDIRDHALTGRYQGFRECHIAPDWLLVYAIDEQRLILTAARTGSHSDLFT